ncbi:MAG: recombinase family protein [Bacillota bacterium]
MRQFFTTARLILSTSVIFLYFHLWWLQWRLHFPEYFFRREICLRALEREYTGTAYWNRTGKDLRGSGQKWKAEEEWIVVEGAHPAIISHEELEELRRVKGPEIQQRKGRGANNPKAVNSPWLLSGPNTLGEPFFRCLNGEGHYLVSAESNRYHWYL